MKITPENGTGDGARPACKRDGCGNPVPTGGRKKYCSAKCRNLASQDHYRANKRRADAQHAEFIKALNTRARHRRCLACGQWFDSTGFAHRKCDDCRRKHDGIGQHPTVPPKWNGKPMWTSGL